MLQVTAICRSAWGRMRRLRCPTTNELAAFCNRSADRCNHYAPIIQAGGSLAAFCIATAALGLTRSQMRIERAQTTAAVMTARASTAQVIHSGSMEHGGTFAVDEQNRINPYSLRSALGIAELERRGFQTACVNQGNVMTTDSPGTCGDLMFRRVPDLMEWQLPKNPPPAPVDPYSGPSYDYSSMFTKDPPYPIEREMEPLTRKRKLRQKNPRKLMQFSQDQVGVPSPSKPQ